MSGGNSSSYPLGLCICSVNLANANAGPCFCDCLPLLKGGSWTILPLCMCISPADCAMRYVGGVCIWVNPQMMQ